MPVRMFVLLICTFFTLRPAGLFGQPASGGTGGPAFAVSLVRVIANPQDFDGKRIRLTGYLGANGVDQSMGLYLSGIDRRNAVFANSIDVHVDPSRVKDLLDGYVILSAIFHASDPRSGSNGYMDQVIEIRKWPPIPPK